MTTPYSSSTSSTSSPRSAAIAGNYSDNNKSVKKKKKTPSSSSSASKKAIKIENIPDDIPDHNNRDANGRRKHTVPYAVTSMETIGGAVAVDVDGSSICPIYVSDYEDSQSESERAVRGDRKVNHLLVAKQHQQEQQQQQSLSKIAHRKNTINQMVQPASVNEENEDEQSTPEWCKNSTAAAAATTSTAAAAAAADIKKKKSSRGISSLKKTIAMVARKSRSKSRDRKKKKEVEGSDQKDRLPLHIDVTAFGDGDDDNDPVLEKELEEIALNGRRSGLISGTPEKVAYDIENGKPKGWRRKKDASMKKKNQILWKRGGRKSIANFDDDDDDADKSGHGAETLAKDNTTTLKQRMMMMLTKHKIWSLVVLVTFLTAIGLLSFSLANKPQPGDPLTEEQQEIHNILSRVSGEKPLTEQGTPQNEARDWLLYKDNIVWDIDSEEGIIQRFTLASLYFATGGGDDTWVENNWLIGPECGDENNDVWFGVNCNLDGDIRSIVLDDWGLSGTIPPEVGHLYRLEHLVLKNNPSLIGWIPVTFSHLGNLKQLALYNNNLSGVIPDIFEHTKSLKLINLEDNNIHGSIPLEIRHLKSLETLVLKNNRMEGIVPFTQLSSTGVKYLGLSHNRFSSRLETSINDMDTIEYLYLDHNIMRGTIPVHIGNLSHLST
jgi:hypothetical protein